MAEELTTLPEFHDDPKDIEFKYALTYALFHEMDRRADIEIRNGKPKKEAEKEDQELIKGVHYWNLDNEVLGRISKLINEYKKGDMKDPKQLLVPLKKIFLEEIEKDEKALSSKEGEVRLSIVLCMNRYFYYRKRNGEDQQYDSDYASDIDSEIDDNSLTISP